MPPGMGVCSDADGRIMYYQDYIQYLVLVRNFDELFALGKEAVGFAMSTPATRHAAASVAWAVVPPLLDAGRVSEAESIVALFPREEQSNGEAVVLRLLEGEILNASGAFRDAEAHFVNPID